MMMIGLFTDCVPEPHLALPPPVRPAQIATSNLLLRKHSPLCQNPLMNLPTSFYESLHRKDIGGAEMQSLLVFIRAGANADTALMRIATFGSHSSGGRGLRRTFIGRSCISRLPSGCSNNALRHIARPQTMNPQDQHRAHY